MKEAAARVKINKLLENAGWRFFADAKGPANVQLEPSVTLKAHDLDALGENFEKAPKGYIDFLLLNEKGFPFIVLEAKAENSSPLAGKEQARRYAKSQNCRFVILSNGNLHYFWDLERGNPYVITAFPTPTSITGYQKSVPDPKRLIEEVSKASGTSKKMELKLTNVARASLEELRLDYEDFLRHRALPLWPKSDPRRAELIARRCTTADAVAAWVKEVHDRARSSGQYGPHGPAALRRQRPASIQSTPSMESTTPTYPELAANAALTLIAVACSLLDRQIAAQAAAFEKEGGFTERLHRIRTARRYSPES